MLSAGKIAEVAKISMKSSLSYITAAWGAFIVTVLQIFIFYYIWMAVYGGHSYLNGISKEKMIMYIILSRILYTQISWSFINIIGGMVHSGQIAMELLMPIDFQLSMYIGRMGDFIAFSSLTTVPAFIICVLSLGFYLPDNPLIYVYFGISLFMALTIAFFAEFFIGMMAFYTTNTWGLRALYESVVSFFSGALIPLVFFPGWLKQAVNFLPFKDMIYTPVSIFLGLVNNRQICESLLFQAVWVIGLFIISRWFFLFAVRKITVQGG